MLHTLLTLLAVVRTGPGHLRMSAAAPRARGPRLLDFEVIGDRPSRDLTIFDTMLRAKPYPPESPFDEATEDIFSQREPPGLLPQPSAAEAEVLRRLYAQRLSGQSVLEVVGDANSRVPSRPRPKRLAQVHTCHGSYAPFSGAGTDQHALFDKDTRIPFTDNSFTTVLMHGCLPYVTHPVTLFLELFRVLEPTGTLVVSWSGKTAPRPGNEFDARHATRAWLQAVDAADALYMCGSFFHYSGNWASLKFDEVAVDNGASSLFVLTATKLTSSAILRRRAQRAVAFNHAPLRLATPPPEPLLRRPTPPTPRVAPVAPAAPASPAPLTMRTPPAMLPPRSMAVQPLGRPPPRAVPLQPVARDATPAMPPAPLQRQRPPPAAPPPRPMPMQPVGRPPAATPPVARDAVASKKPLYEVMRQARQADLLPAAPAPEARKPPPPPLLKAAAPPPPPPPVKQRPGAPAAAAAGAAVPPGGPGGAGGTSSERVRATIMETMKRGITQARDRTDLAPGEKAMLEHMKMYVMETKLAEGALSADELQIWNDIKADYQSKASSSRPGEA